MRRRRYLKQCAKDIIFSASGSGLFDNLFSVLILAAVSAGLVQTGYIFIALFEPYVSDVGIFGLVILFTALWFFAVCPVFYGFMKRMIYVSEGNNTSAAAMFYAFSSRRELALSYRLFFAFALWGICVYGVYALIFSSPIIDVMLKSGVMMRFAAVFGFGTVLHDMTAFCKIITAVLAALAAALSLERIMCAFYLTARGLTRSVSTAYRTAGRIMKGKRTELLTIFLSFIPWLILSFITAGIVFAVFVLPYIILTVTLFFRYAERRYTFESGEGIADRIGITDADRDYLSADSPENDGDTKQSTLGIN